MRTTGSTPDPYTYQRRDIAPGYGEPKNLDIYTPVSSALVPGENTGVFLIYGQSNCANMVDSTYTVTQAKNHMLNPMNGGMYKTKEPILGCNGILADGTVFTPGTAAGNWTAQLGDLLISAGTFDRVIICNVAAITTNSRLWAKGGACNNRLIVAANRIKAAGLTVTRVLRHQGENDAFQYLTITAAETTSNIRSEVETLRYYGIDARVIMAHVGYTGTSSVGGLGYTSARLGQTNAVSAELGIIMGPDTDIYGSAYRQADDLHWNASGRTAVATAFKNAIIADL